MTDVNKAYQVKANDFVFYFDKKEIDAIDLIQKSPAEFNCIKNHRSVNAKLIDADIVNKKFIIRIEGEVFSIEIKDELDQMLENMGFGSIVSKRVTNIKAPMPGLVLAINAEERQAVKKGDKVLILEAMKMENIIVAPEDAIIKKILISKGQAVDRGQVLIELE